MSDFDATRFRTKVEGLTDDELIAVVSINASHYAPEAVAIAKQHVELRGLADDVQTVIFDVFLNTSGFAGRLILLDEQLMFLSTGLRAASGGGLGLVGSIAGEANLATRAVAARKSDFSALDNEGSWIYYLDQIRICETKSSFLSGKHLLFKVAEENGTITDGVLQCDELSTSDFESIAKQINDVMKSHQSPSQTN